MVDETRNPWRLRSQRLAFRNRWISVEDHDVLTPAGGPGRYGVVRFANRAIGVLPIDGEGCTFLVGQWRYPLARYSWELPEGGGPLGEDPLDAARRELQEETGCTARGWAEFVQFDVSNCISDEVGHAFLAWDLEVGEAAPDETEDLALKRVPFRALYEDVMAGRVRDSYTIVMVLKARAMAVDGTLPKGVPAAISEALKA